MTVGAALFSLLLRQFDLSPLASWIGGFTFLTGMWWTIPYSPGMFMPPSIALLLWSLRDTKGHPWRAVCSGTLVLLHAWYAMHWVHLPLLWVTGGIVAGFLSWERWGKTPLLLFLLTFLASAALALPKILPALLYAELSLRGGGLAWQAATTGGVRPLTFLQLLFPFLELPLLDFGRAPIFIGVFSLGFALAALTQRRTGIRALALGYLLILLLSIDHSPLFWLLQKVPPFSYIRGEGRWMPVANVAAAALAAAGFDVLLQDDTKRTRELLGVVARWIAALFLAGSVALTLTLVFLRDPILSFLREIFDTFLFPRTSGLPRTHYYGVIENYLNEVTLQFSLMNPRFLFPLLAVLCLGILFSRRVWGLLGALRGSALAAAALLTTLPILFVQHTTISRASFPWETQTSAYLRDHPGLSYSVFPNFAKFLVLDPLHPSQDDSVRFQAELLIPNRNLWYGIPSADYFDNIMSRRMGRILAWIGSEQTQVRGEEALARLPATPEEKIRLLLQRKDILDILNVKTLLSPWPLEHPDLIQTQKLYITKKQIPLFLYENTAARPFAYFADAVSEIEEDEERAFAMLTGDAWSGRRTLIECQSACPILQPTGRGSVEVRNEQPTTIVLETKTHSPEWLVVSVNNLPGWEVRIDGEEVEPAIAMTTFFGIPLPAGKHAVTMTFSYERLIRDSFRWSIANFRSLLPHYAREAS